MDAKDKMTLVKYLGLATLLAATTLGTGCSNSVLHKEGAAYVAREAVEPITRSLDDLRLDELTYELKELVKTTEESIKTGEKTVEQLTITLQKITLLTEDIRVLVNNLDETRVETTELIKTARGLLLSVNELMPEVTRLISNVNSLVEDTREDLKEGTTDSIWMKFLPWLIGGIALLAVILILLSVIKRKK